MIFIKKEKISDTFCDIKLCPKITSCQLNYTRQKVYTDSTLSDHFLIIISNSFYKRKEKQPKHLIKTIKWLANDIFSKSILIIL